MRFILSITIVFLFSFAQQNCDKGTMTPTKVKNSEVVKTNTNTSTAAVPSAAHDDDAPRISLAEAKTDFDAGKAVFVDTRAAESYNLEHVKGSLNISLGDFEVRYKEIPTDKKIIAYCSWPSEYTSASLVQKLKEKGIKNAFALVGGTKAWKDAGYPMEKSK